MVGPVWRKEGERGNQHQRLFSQRGRGAKNERGSDLMLHPQNQLKGKRYMRAKYNTIRPELLKSWAQKSNEYEGDRQLMPWPQRNKGRGTTYSYISVAPPVCVCECLAPRGLKEKFFLLSFLLSSFFFPRRKSICTSSLSLSLSLSTHPHCLPSPQFRPLLSLSTHSLQLWRSTSTYGQPSPLEK